MYYFFLLLRRDFQLSMRQDMSSFMVIMFFIFVVILFTLGIGPDTKILTRISPAVIWVAALLSNILLLERLFLNDYEDGTLDLLIISPIGLEFIVLAKILVHWIITSIPIIVAAPVLAIIIEMPSNGVWILITALALGTPTLSLLGAVCSALILGSRGGGILLSLMILPLFVPVLIFGVSAIDGSINEYGSETQLLILGGLLALALSLCPWATATCIKQALD